MPDQAGRCRFARRRKKRPVRSRTRHGFQFFWGYIAYSRSPRRIASEDAIATNVYRLGKMVALGNIGETSLSFVRRPFLVFGRLILVASCKSESR